MESERAFMKQKMQGQSLTEYGLIMALVALLCLPVLVLLKDSIGGGVTHMLPSSKPNNPTTTNILPSGSLPNASPNTNVVNTEVVVSNVVASQDSVDSKPVSTAGSNGDSSIVQANASKLLTIAAKYTQTTPKLSNALVQLGQLGQQMGQAIASNDKLAASQIWSNFTDLYTDILLLPGVYGKLNPEDQTLVKTLNNQSSQLTANFTGTAYTGHPGLDDYNGVPASSDTKAAEQVQSNSDQTVQCGQNMKCN
jgi:hypothetical protein